MVQAEATRGAQQVAELLTHADDVERTVLARWPHLAAWPVQNEQLIAELDWIEMQLHDHVNGHGRQLVLTADEFSRLALRAGDIRELLLEDQV